MDLQTKQKYIDYMGEYVTENRKKRIDEVLARRTRHIVVALEDIFQPTEKLVLNHINDASNVDYKLEAHKISIGQVFEDIQEKINSIDQTLVSTSKSELAKIYKSLDHLEGKLKKSVKQKEEVQIKRPFRAVLV